MLSWEGSSGSVTVGIAAVGGDAAAISARRLGLRSVSAERGEARSNARRKVGVAQSGQSQECAVVLDGNSRIAAVVGDNGQVVVRPCALGRKRDGPFQQIASFLKASGSPFDQREIDQRLDVVRVERERLAQFGPGLIEPAGGEMKDAEIVVRLHVPGIENERPFELGLRATLVSAIAVQQTEVVVYFRSRVTLLEEHPVLRERVVVVAHPLVIQSQPEMIRGRRRRDRHRWSVRRFLG